jgi:hypothetical protein
MCYDYIMEEKKCQSCNQYFLPSSRHKNCPLCRYKNYKDSCDCGNKKSHRSSLCILCSQKGDLNGNWKGGKYKNSKGYILIKFPEHPRAAKSGYIFEHRLVMESIIGRYLLPNENVHHKNGIKDDNRSENLELWITYQPNGQRAEDLVAWAREILFLYS